MGQDTHYEPIAFIFASAGLVARPIDDQTPPHTYLNLDSAEEREENAMSSRYGSVIITRDPNGTVGGTNYFLPNQIHTLSRLKYGASSWRYAGDVLGNLYRRTGDTQGAYTQILTGLSGQRFSSVVMNCFGSSQPYLFIADAAKMVKDVGTGTPTKVGIDPPNYTANTQVYPPNIFLIDGFNNALGGYTTSGLTSWVAIGVVNVTTPGFTTYYPQFSSYVYGTVTSGLQYVFNGCLATFGTSTMPTYIDITSVLTTDLVSGSYTTVTVTTESAHGLVPGNYAQIQGCDNPIFDGLWVVTSVPNGTTFKFAFTSILLQSGTRGEFSRYTTYSPQALMFNIFGDPQPNTFTAIGVYGPLDPTKLTFPVQFYEATVAAASTGSLGKTVAMDLLQDGWATDDDLIVVGMSVGDPATLTSVTVQFDVNGSNYTEGYFSKQIPILTNAGSGDLAYYLRMGDFTKFGSAGQDNWTWANVTGWRIVITTATGTAGNVFLNALYQQWGYGPSSFGGIGYDYRYTYFNAVTLTESNGSPIQEFSTQYGYLGSLTPPIALRQAIQVTGYYSVDPQVTHVRIYRRGGTLGSNWFLVDQIPNPGYLAQFSYQDTTSDADLTQASTLILSNDVPVTSSLRNPVIVSLPTSITPARTDVWQGFSPVGLGISGFTIGQIVDVGTPQNLEQVRVIGTSHSGDLVVLRLRHAAGEPVVAYSIPGQPCDLIEEAYGQLWYAGDPNNPHYLYFSNPGYPENVGPQNYIPVGTPDSPIMAIINFRGTLCVATLTTWYLVIGGAAPYAQPTGSNHGMVAKHGWTLTESAIQYQAVDGIREFKGADGAYLSILIEWLYRQTPQALTPVELPNLSQLSNVTMAFQNNDTYIVYVGQDSANHRLCWNSTYKRWRNDDVNATAIFYEKDTNELLLAKYMSVGGQSGYAIVQDRVNDYDDGGWSGGGLQQTPIAVTIQPPFQDLGKPHFPKQWNMLELDVNTHGQTLNVTLYFDDGITPAILVPVSTTQRQKVQLPINNGDGIESYKMSPVITMSVTTAPIIYQMNMYCAVLAANRSTFDTYWIKFGNDESKLIKQLYFDYTSSSQVTVNVYADGQTTPYYTFTLRTNTARAAVPQRVRLPAIKCRMWRCVATCAQGQEFQFWSAPQVDAKPCMIGKTYETQELVV